ncbi:MAG TPA: hypothetical protein ENJ29_00230 [Bacteroidetes bacterium]|nr:hypothetical protein [Bacteroidota bacterium]
MLEPLDWGVWPGFDVQATVLRDMNVAVQKGLNPEGLVFPCRESGRTVFGQARAVAFISCRLRR